MRQLLKFILLISFFCIIILLRIFIKKEKSGGKARPLNMELIKKNNKFYMSENAYIMDVLHTDGVYEPEHTHDFIEIVYTFKGKCRHIVDGELYNVKHGDVLFINYNQTHSISGENETEIINILIRPEYINESLKNNENAFALLHLLEFEDFSKILNENKTKLTFSGEERENFENIIKNMLKEFDTKAPGYELLIRSQFNIILIILFRKMSLNLEESFYGISDKLLSYITQHCNEKLSLESIAKLCSYNKSYFSRIFKEYTNNTFTEYLKNARMEKAKELLKNTDYSITNIVYKSGYSDKTKFFAHFKSYTGVSPLQYRKYKSKK